VHGGNGVGPEFPCLGRLRVWSPNGPTETSYLVSIVIDYDHTPPCPGQLRNHVRDTGTVHEDMSTHPVEVGLRGVGGPGNLNSMVIGIFSGRMGVNITRVAKQATSEKNKILLVRPGAEVEGGENVIITWQALEDGFSLFLNSRAPPQPM